MKLSVLTFSKDNQDLLFNLIKNVEDIASEIIIIDSSSQDVYLELKNKLKKNRKIRIFHYKALGYVEPFRMLGISKCNYEFVFYLDSDEYLNRRLINYLRKIKIPNNVSGLRVSRVSVIKNGKKRPIKIAGSDIRIFRKKNVRYEGIIHEVPIITGDVIDLQPYCKVYNLAYEINNNPKKSYNNI
jgi:glycosyltransferase involved in cell wall biosynthesis